MHRIFLATGFVLATSLPVSAQSWVPWHQTPVHMMFGSGQNAGPSAANPGKAGKGKKAGDTSAYSGFFASFGYDEDEPGPAKPTTMLEGGPRPDIEPQAPQSTTYRSAQAPGSIVIDTAARKLYLIRSASSAYVYPISVGRDGFTWTGEQTISRVANWPDWHPPAEMRERNPRLPVKMTGGLYNPLGAKALYLGNSLYRIHGTSDAKSIGRAASSGCFRMHNRHVVDLASRVGVGTRVVVIKASPARTASSAR